MNPVITLVGRSNVGKSTLFNYLTKSNDALVANRPGLTRDRIYGVTRRFGKRYIVIDTGGITATKKSNEEDRLNQAVTSHVWRAIEEANVLFFMVDGQQGLVPRDQDLFAKLRNSNQEIFVLVNKVDSGAVNVLATDFFELGAEHVFEISARLGKGIRDVVDAVEKYCPLQEEPQPQETGQDVIKVAIVGKPNVGKSTLANALIGEERFITSRIPGTTRDSVSERIEKFGATFELVDTAGVRRRSKVHDVIEKISVVKTLQAIETSHVVMLMLDGTQGLTEQDARLAGMVLNSGRAVVATVNKIDVCSKEDYKAIQKGFDLKLHFLDFAERYLVSAKQKRGITKLMRAVMRAYHATNVEVQTAELNRMLKSALENFQPPLVRGRRVKLKYAVQVNKCPPTFAIYGGQVGKIPETYRRYLENYFRKTLRLIGTPVHVVFR